MTAEEIRLLRLANQHLTAPADKLTVVRDLCGIQAQFLSNAIHAMRIRCADFDESSVGDGLAKNWTIRGTVHIFAEADLPLFLRCNDGRDYRSGDWTGKSWWNQRPDWALTPERQAYLSRIILAAVAEGPCTREALKLRCREAGMTEPEEGSMFHPWGGGIRELCQRGFLNQAVSEEKIFRAAPEFVPMPGEEAERELARRYFTHYGPATVHDAMYFFHAAAAQVKKWLSALPVCTCEWDGKTYFSMKEPVSSGVSVPECLFLAGFDPLMLCYEKKESLFLKPEHLRGIFNLAGIVMPAVLLRGQVAGRWKKQGSKLTVELFEPLEDTDRAKIRDAAESMWNGITKLEWK